MKLEKNSTILQKICAVVKIIYVIQFNSLTNKLNQYIIWHKTQIKISKNYPLNILTLNLQY
jgi:hypothetical protein